jgi:DNA-directed RNA polymerase specialized sigma24 family protein
MERGRKEKEKAEAKVEAGGGAEGKAKVRKDIREAIRQVLDGESEQYAVIYKLCDRSLRGYVGLRFGRLGDDFVDEVAVRTHEYALGRLGEYDESEGASYQTWLNIQSRSITSRVITEWYGDNFVRLDEEFHEPQMPTQAGPAEIHDERMRNQAIRHELRALAEPARLSIAHHDLAERTFQVTARHLNISVSRMRWLRGNALGELRRRLRKLGVRPTRTAPATEPVIPPKLYKKNPYDDGDWTTSVSADMPFVPGDLVGAEPWPTEE